MNNIKETEAEVICQHKLDGSIIPIKIRFVDENGEWQTYQVSWFAERKPGEVSSFVPESIPATSSLRRFDCIIEVFEMERKVVLYYNCNHGKWRIKYVL